jgi:PKD repeat protein
MKSILTSLIFLSVIVIAYPNPTADAGHDYTICLGKSVTLGDGLGMGYSYEWSPTQGLNNPTSHHPVASPTITTTYILTVTNDYGCTDTDDVIVTVNPLPTAGFSLSPTCMVINTDITFTNLSTDATDYHWNFGDGSVSEEENPTHQFSEYGYYCITFIVSNACGSDTIHETKYMAKHGVYKHLINTSVNSPVLQQFKQQSDNGNLGLLEKVNNNLITGNYLQAQQFNNAISPAGIPENSLKTINDIYINNLINNSCFDSIISFTCAQTNVLKSIAQQCPYQYGKAVYQARMLLGFVDTAQYCNECEIIFPPSDNKRLIIGNKDNNDIVKLYPNPAKNEITIEFNYLIEENILFELYDVLGNKVMCRQLLRNNNKVNVSTKNLNQGIYFYKIILNNNIIASDKLVIIK